MVANRQANEHDAESVPSPNGPIGGRDGKGRFARGNTGGPGNPHAKRVAELRKMIADAVSEDDLRDVVAALIERARGGDVVAIRELLDRLVGKAAAGIDPERLALDQQKIALAEDSARATKWKD